MAFKHFLFLPYATHHDGGSFEVDFLLKFDVGSFLSLLCTMLGLICFPLSCSGQQMNSYSSVHGTRRSRRGWIHPGHRGQWGPWEENQRLGRQKGIFFQEYSYCGRVVKNMFCPLAKCLNTRRMNSFLFL